MHELHGDKAAATIKYVQHASWVCLKDCQCKNGMSRLLNGQINGANINGVSLGARWSTGPGRSGYNSDNKPIYFAHFLKGQGDCANTGGNRGAPQNLWKPMLFLQLPATAHCQCNNRIYSLSMDVIALRKMLTLA